MPSFTGGNLGLTWGYIPHEDGWSDSYNGNFQALDALVHLVVTEILSTPPGAPAAEDTYIVGAAATGAWAGQEDKLAVYTKMEDPDSRAWVFLTPKNGYRAFNVDTTSWWQYDGADWVEDATAGSATFAGLTDASITSPATGDILRWNSTDWANVRPHYGLGFSAPQITAYSASQVVGVHRFSCAVTIPANFGTYNGRVSQAGGSAVAAASTVFNVDKAASATPNSFSNVGTITFAIGTITPTFASSGGTAISFAAGDVIRIVAPATPDTTFAGFYATLVGSET